VESVRETPEERSKERRHRANEDIDAGGTGKGEGAKRDLGRGDLGRWRGIEVHGIDKPRSFTFSTGCQGLDEVLGYSDPGKSRPVRAPFEVLHGISTKTNPYARLDLHSEPDWGSYRTS